ncbi:MAG TPA: glycosyltransferase [Caulobacteraceae bacterium]
MREHTSKRNQGAAVSGPAAKPLAPIMRTPEAVVINDFTPAMAGIRCLPAAPAEAPLISILILTLDGRDLLDRLFTSFSGVNSYPNFEFVVVDHGSTDATLELLRDWARRLPIKVLARGANFSFSESNNKAARLAAGALLLLLNNDLVFATDCLAGMAAALADQCIGAVGLKQYQGVPDSPEPRRVYHLGVRFGWNIVERRLRPHHVKPSAMDARLMDAVAAFPAVTASALLCRREDYLAVGGLSEAYVYGLEDVDFCCKIRWRLGKEVVCCNPVFAFHPKNATRNRDAANRRPLEKQNRRVLQARCGYGIRRDFLARRLDDDGSLTGRPYTIGLAVPSEGPGQPNAELDAAITLGEILRRRFGWKVHFLGPDLWSDASELDLYASFSPNADIGALSGAEPHLVTACCLLGEAAAWLEPPWFDRFDLRFCAQEAVHAQLKDRFGQADCFGEKIEALACRLHDRLAQAAQGYRIALKTGPNENSPGRAIALKRALMRRGHLARIDAPTEWYGPPSLADDVVLALDASYRPAEDQINVRLSEASSGGASTPANWDAVVIRRRPRGASGGRGASITVLPARILPEAEVEAVLSLLDVLHADRAAGPADPPLSDPRKRAPPMAADATTVAEIEPDVRERPRGVGLDPG